LWVANCITAWGRTDIMITSCRCYGMPDCCEYPAHAPADGSSPLRVQTTLMVCAWLLFHGTWFVACCCLHWNFTFYHNRRSCIPNHQECVTMHTFIHSVVCLTTGPQPLPKRVLHRVRSNASSFNLQYLLFSLRSSSSFLRLLPRLPVISILLTFLQSRVLEGSFYARCDQSS
jgi:hypothetical protein